jgi:tetratricopeptide (TPR) repeat protein
VTGADRTPVPEDLVEFWESAPKQVRARLVAEARAAAKRDGGIGQFGEADDDDDDVPDDADDADEADDALPPGRAGQFSAARKNLLIVAAIIGVVLAVWAIGRPPADGGASADPSSGAEASQSSVDYSARAAELEAALEADPANTDIMLELGVAYFNSGNLDLASEQWNKVAELDPDSALAWYNLGFYYLARDPAEVDLARAAWEKVLELEPGTEMAASVASHLEALDTSFGAESADAAPSPSGTADAP